MTRASHLIRSGPALPTFGSGHPARCSSPSCYPPFRTSPPSDRLFSLPAGSRRSCRAVVSRARGNTTRRRARRCHVGPALGGASRPRRERARSSGSTRLPLGEVVGPQLKHAVQHRRGPRERQAQLVAHHVGKPCPLVVSRNSREGPHASEIRGVKVGRRDAALSGPPAPRGFDVRIVGEVMQQRGDRARRSGEIAEGELLIVVVRHDRSVSAAPLEGGRVGGKAGRRLRHEGEVMTLALPPIAIF